ncbi:Rz1-like lysis system protein LysC [Pseudomonas aeruginosa]
MLRKRPPVRPSNWSACRPACWLSSSARSVRSPRSTSACERWLRPFPPMPGPRARPLGSYAAMTRLSMSICAGLCLLALAGCTNGPRPPTQAPTAGRQFCPLVPCVLPARPAVLVNDQWRQALDDTEAALLSCANQVLGCIQRQDAQRPK